MINPAELYTGNMDVLEETHYVDSDGDLTPIFNTPSFLSRRKQLEAVAKVKGARLKIRHQLQWLVYWLRTESSVQTNLDQVSVKHESLDDDDDPIVVLGFSEEDISMDEDKTMEDPKVIRILVSSQHLVLASAGIQTPTRWSTR